MADLIWNKNFETGIEIIDEQHQELFRKIDSITLAIYEGQGKKHVRELIDFLDVYISNHFETEEKLLYDNYYTDISKHINFHKEFIKVFKDYNNDFLKNGPDNYLAIRMEKEIRAWWENHILKIDKLYVPFIKSADPVF
jgi:hemerythrin